MNTKMKKRGTNKSENTCKILNQNQRRKLMHRKHKRKKKKINKTDKIKWILKWKKENLGEQTRAKTHEKY